MGKYSKYQPTIEIQKKLGERVRSLRLNAGLSQEELAFRSNIHRTYMSEVELGKRNISLKNIEAISKALGISISSSFDFDKTHEKKV